MKHERILSISATYFLLLFQIIFDTFFLFFRTTEFKAVFVPIYVIIISAVYIAVIVFIFRKRR
jgi:hypothetical protein